MKGILTFLIVIIASPSIHCQTEFLEIGRKYNNVHIEKPTSLTYKLNFKSDREYHIYVLQKGIDVALTLTDNKQRKLLEKDSPNGESGFEQFYYHPGESSCFNLTIKPYEEGSKFNSGFIDIYIKELTNSESMLRRQTMDELKKENNKNILTLDIMYAHA